MMLLFLWTSIRHKWRRFAMTKSVVSLPFFVPTFAVFQNCAMPEFALSQRDSGEIPMINQYIDLACLNKFLNGYTSPWVTLPGANIENYKCFIRYIVHMTYAYEICESVIRKMLNDGMYIYFKGFDDFYIRGKSWYGIKHMKHDGIISGYDDINNTYDIIAYDIDWKFNCIKVPQSCFIESMYKAIEQEFLPYIVSGKIKDTTFFYEPKEICSNIKKYLDSDLNKYPVNKEGKVQGIVVHDYLAMYMEKLLDGSIPHESMDWRPMRAVWEYRVYTQKRILALEQSLKLDNSISEIYQHIVDDSNNMRIMYAIYHKRKKDTLIKSIQKGLLDLKEREKNILSELVSKAEEVIKK